MNCLRFALPRALLRIAYLVPVFVAVGSTLAGGAAFAQGSARKVVELESQSARDLSLSLLRDNYDVWAEEMAKKNASELSRRLSAQDSLLDELSRRESEMSSDLRKKLSALAYSGPADDSALKAALFISARSAGQERRNALQRATLLAQQISPASEQALEVAVMFTADLLVSGAFDQAIRMSAKIVAMSGQARLASSTAACLAKVVAADVSFQQREFSNAAELYGLARECYGSKSKGKAPQGVYLDLRSAWVAFRLTRYADVLAHLTQFTRDPGSDTLSVNPLLAADLATMLGVALSEVDAPLPASHWQRLAAQTPWVAAGLSKSIRYLLQRDNDNLAMRWSDVLEPSLAGTSAADDFYSAAADAAEKQGLIERQIDFKERGVLALQVNGQFARTLSRDPKRDQRRSDRVVAWAKDVISFRAAQSSGKMSSTKALQFFRVSDAIARENVEFCKSTATLKVAHRVLSTAQHVVFSEKIFALLSECRLSKTDMEEIRTARLEMYQLVWKENTKDLQAWKRYLAEVLDTLAFSAGAPEVRRIALDALNDSIEFSFLANSEELLTRLYASYSDRGESSQMERLAFFSAAVRLLSLQSDRSGLEKLSWLMHRDAASILGVSDSSRRHLEASLAAYVLGDAARLKQEGRLLVAAERLRDAGERMGRDSEFGRDLVYLSAKAFCSSGFEKQCLETSRSIVLSAAHSEQDKFHTLRWLGIVYAAQGRFVAAGSVWVSSSELAIASARPELLLLSASDLVRAGNIFAELKLWQETLQVKALLLKVGESTGQSAIAYRSVLDWSVAALHEEAFDKAELLSDGLTALAVEQRKELSTISNSVLSFAPMVELYARTRARKLSASGIEARLLGFISGRTAPLTESAMRGVLPLHAISVARSAFSFWRGEIERDAERLVAGQSVTEFRENAVRLGQLFGSLMKGCAVLAKQPNLSGSENKSCSRDISARFVDLNARVLSGLARVSAASSAELSSVYRLVQLQGDEFRRGALSAPRLPAVSPEAGFAVLESPNVLSVKREVSR